MGNTIFKDFNHQHYRFTYNKADVQLHVVHNYLSQQSYWAQNIPLETVERSVQNSICLSILTQQGEQVGFGRMITDQATFAYLADIFILEPHRGKGLSKTMVQAFCTLGEHFGLRRFLLTTQDAHGLYQQFGFGSFPWPERLMSRPGVVYK